MRIKVLGSARRYRIGNAHILAALNSDTVTVIEARDNGAVFVIATDDRGVELEIGYRPAWEPGIWIVFHCMPTHYREGNR